MTTKSSESCKGDFSKNEREMKEEEEEGTAPVTVTSHADSEENHIDNKTEEEKDDDKNLPPFAKVQKLISTNVHVGWPETHPGYAPLKHGWFFQSHQDVLKYLIHPSRTTTIIEIGSWLGRSTEYLTKTAPNAVVYAIDLWDDTVIQNDSHYNSSAENMAILKSGPLYDRFLSNMWDYRSQVATSSSSESTTLSPGIIPLKMDGCEGLHILQACGVVPDLVYIDASHHYDSVVKDISTVLQMYPQADVVGDDWDYPDVQRAVKECAERFQLEIHVSGYKCWTYSKKKVEDNSKESKKREREDQSVRQESLARQSKIQKMSMKDLLGHYKKKK